jgi:hypothetical protein
MSAAVLEETTEISVAGGSLNPGRLQYNSHGDPKTLALLERSFFRWVDLSRGRWTAFSRSCEGYPALRLPG